MKYLVFSSLFFFSQNIFSFDNQYLRPSIDSHVEKFLSSEIVVVLN
jgi:hypothetical protein